MYQEDLDKILIEVFDIVINRFNDYGVILDPNISENEFFTDLENLLERYFVSDPLGYRNYN